MVRKSVILLISIGVYYVCVYSIFYIVILTRKNSTRLLLEKIGKESREYDGKWIHKSLYRSSDEISGKLTVVSKPNTDDSGIWDNIEFGCEEEQYDKNTPDIDPDDSEAVIFLVQAGACNYEDKIDVAKKFLKKGKLAKNPAGIIIFDGQSDKIIDKSLNDNAKNKTKETSFPVVEVQIEIVDEMWERFDIGIDIANATKRVDVTIGNEKEEKQEVFLMMIFLPTLVLLILRLLWISCCPPGSFTRKTTTDYASKLFMLKDKRQEKKRMVIYERVINSFQKAEVSDDVKNEMKKIYISKKMLKVDSEIGAGHFGNVYRGHLRCQEKNSISSNKTTFVPVAVKRFKKEKCCAGYPRNFCPNTTDYFKEASFVIRAKSKYVVDIKGLAIEDGNHPVIVMPLYSKYKSLCEYVGNTTNTIRFTHALKLLFQCASGFDFLAQNKILHRDISAKNILLDDNLVPKISDFGLSSYTTEEYGSCYYTMKNNDKPHPLRNFAPEVFKFEFSTYSDIYSFGYVIWEVFNRGGHPLDGVKGLNTWDMIKTYKENVDMKHELPFVLFQHQNVEVFSDVANLLRLTWSYERSERKSFTHYYEGFKAAYNYVGRRNDTVLDINLQKPSILRASSEHSLPEHYYLNNSAADLNHDYRNWLVETGSFRYLRPLSPTSPVRGPLSSTSSSVSNARYGTPMENYSNIL